MFPQGAWQRMMARTRQLIATMKPLRIRVLLDGVIAGHTDHIYQAAIAAPITLIRHQLQMLAIILVLVSARTTIAPPRIVFPKADEKAAAIITTRGVSVTRKVLI